MKSLRTLLMGADLFYKGLLLDGLIYLTNKHLEHRATKGKLLSDKISILFSQKIYKSKRKWQLLEKNYRRYLM